MVVTSTSIVPLIYTGTGTTDTYVYGFTIFQASDLVVERLTISTGVKETLTLDALTDGYEVETDIDGNFTGNIILSDGNLPSTQQLIVYPDYPLNQNTDYRSYGPFPAETHEQGLDKLTLICQQLQEQLDRCVKSTIESGDTDPSADDILDDMNDTLTAAVAAQTAAEAAQSASETAQTASEAAQTAAEAAQAAAEAAVAQINAEIHDADDDTAVEVERTSDDDTIRFKVAGSDKGKIDASGLQLAASGSQVDTILDEDDMSSDDANALITQQSAKAYIDRMRKVFTSSGNYSVPAGCSKIRVTVIGGGGGGGGGASGGVGNGGGAGGDAAEQIIRHILPVTAESSLTITIGAAGSAGAIDGVGGAGGDSSVAGGDYTLTATGGAGGNKGTATGGAAGSGTSGTIEGAVLTSLIATLTGSGKTPALLSYPGGAGAAGGTGATDSAGAGGSTMLTEGGTGGEGDTSASPTAPTAGKFGSGGGGGSGNNGPGQAGAAGGAGIIIIEPLI